MSEWDDVTGCFQCDLYVSEHDPETLAAHRAATDAEMDDWEARVLEQARTLESATVDPRRRRHLRSVATGDGNAGGRS